MKKKLVPILLILASFSLNSCQKCVTCSYYTLDANGNPNPSTEVGSQCGAEPDLAAIEDECATAAQTVNGTCECTNH
jgi:hypothetical protein